MPTGTETDVLQLAYVDYLFSLLDLFNTFMTQLILPGVASAGVNFLLSLFQTPTT